MIIVVLAMLLIGCPRDTTNDDWNIYTNSTPGSIGVYQQSTQLHGYWTIEVRESDGSLVSRHEFENEVQGHYGRFWARDRVLDTLQGCLLEKQQLDIGRLAWIR